MLKRYEQERDQRQKQLEEKRNERSKQEQQRMREFLGRQMAEKKEREMEDRSNIQQ